MGPLKLLIVDDEPDWVKFISDLLRTVTPMDLVGEPYEGMEIHSAKNQEEARQAIEATNYDLVLLDLRYPEQGDTPLEEDDEEEEQTERVFQGMLWLPELRRQQSQAIIVILTSFAGETYLKNAVNAVRDYHANEFIPKDEPFLAIVLRIRKACQAARTNRQVIILERELHSLMRSKIALTYANAYAEDFGGLLSQFSVSMSNLANRIESGNQREIELAPGVIRAGLSNFKNECEELAQRLDYSDERPRVIDVVDEVRTLLLFSQRFIEEAQAQLVPPQNDEPVWLTTFPGDLKVALLELLTNAADALQNSDTPTKSRVLKVMVERASENVVVRVRDNGGGFTAEAVQNLFKPGFTTKDQAGEPDAQKHKGMGLYIAQRMMHHIGGRIDVSNAAEGWAEIILTLRNLS